MYKKLVSKIFLALLSSLVIIQSCQIPNINDNKNQARSNKIEPFNTKAKVTHVEDYSNPYIFGFSYDREVDFKISSINLFHFGEADPKLYLISEDIYNSNESASASIQYEKIEKKWLIGLFNRYFDIPAKGGNITYQNSSGDGRYTEDYTINLKVSDTELTFNLFGQAILNDAYSTGPHSIPTYCEGVDLLIHSGMCYYHYNSIQTDKYNTTVKIPLRTSEINLSIPDKELGCGVKSTDIGVTVDNEFEGWTLEISGTEGIVYRNVIEGSGNKVIKFDSEGLPVGTYEVKAFYTKFPESVESDTIKVIPSDQCPNECDCSNNLNGFGIKAYPCDKNQTCPDPLLYPNDDDDDDDPYKNCPSFDKNRNRNKDYESIVIGVYDFDSGENKPNLTVVLRPNGINNHYGSFGKNDGTPDSVTKNNIANTIVYVKGDTNKTNLLISNDNPPKDPKKNWDFNHDAKTGTIEINTHKDNNQRASYKDILEKCSNSVEIKIIQDLAKNITTDSNSSPDNIVAGYIKSNGIVSSAPEASYRVDMPKQSINLPVLGIKLENLVNTMKIGDTKTIVLENNGIFIELNLKYKGKNKDNPKESVWEVLCGRDNTGEIK